MNRLSPLIVRRVGPLAPAAAYSETGPDADLGGGLLEDLKLFAVAWLGGLVFFGTLFS